MTLSRLDIVKRELPLKCGKPSLGSLASLQTFLYQNCVTCTSWARVKDDVYLDGEVLLGKRPKVLGGEHTGHAGGSPGQGDFPGELDKLDKLDKLTMLTMLTSSQC